MWSVGNSRSRRLDCPGGFRRPSASVSWGADISSLKNTRPGPSGATLCTAFRALEEAPWKVRTADQAPPEAPAPLRTANQAPPEAPAPIRTAYRAPPEAPAPLRTAYLAPSEAPAPLCTTNLASREAPAPLRPRPFSGPLREILFRAPRFPHFQPPPASWQRFRKTTSIHARSLACVTPKGNYFCSLISSPAGEPNEPGPLTLMAPQTRPLAFSPAQRWQPSPRCQPPRARGRG